MKKIIAIALSAVILAAVFSGCSKPEKDTTDTQKTSSTVMQTVLNTAEYTLYQNIFYNDTKADYNGKNASKEGVFTSIYDAYNSRERYYVWGYNDQTKCCDWQWELNITDTKKLPIKGSLVKVEGVYEVSDAALDGLWIINPEISVKSEYAGNGFDVDMKTMSNTLERVQAYNIVNFPDIFEGKSVCGYGRILDASTLEDAYYDNSWTIGISGDYEVPAFGTLVEIEGKINNGEITQCKISENTIY